MNLSLSFNFLYHKINYLSKMPYWYIHDVSDWEIMTYLVWIKIHKRTQNIKPIFIFLLKLDIPFKKLFCIGLLKELCKKHCSLRCKYTKIHICTASIWISDNNHSSIHTWKIWSCLITARKIKSVLYRHFPENCRQ